MLSRLKNGLKISPLEEITLRTDSIDFTGFVGPKSKMLKAAEQIASR